MNAIPQSVTEKKITKTTKTIIINLPNTSQNLFYYEYNRRSKLFRRYSAPQRMNQRCMDRTGPVVFQKNTYSESYKGKHTCFFQSKLRSFGKKLKRDHPDCISKAPKNKHTPRVFDLTKNRFQNKKMKRLHKENHLGIERNGTFFLLLRRFLNYPIWSSHCMAAM